jgi:hypothetical protein
MSQALMERAPAPAPAPPSEPAADTTLGPRWMSPVVLLLAIVAGASTFSWFCQHSRELWWWMGHDRHTHYNRLAVLPSIAGWVLAIWCAFLIPRRLLASGGNAAGLLAALFVAVSPAHRAYASDCMYESLGAGLTLAALYLYLVVVQDGTRRTAVLLGLTLSALFLHKYTYWTFVVLGLTFGEIARQPRAWLAYGLSWCQRDRLPAWALAELKQPLNWVALALVVAALAVGITGGGTIAVGRWSVSVQEPHNLVHLAYIAFFLRAVWWWRQSGRTWSLDWPPLLRTVLLWHGSIIALWFLMPKRLSYFFWYLTLANDQPRESRPFMHGLPYYRQALTDDYLPLTFGLYLLGGMLVLALLVWRKLKPGSAALFLFLFLAIGLSCQHPVLKNRLMHTWITSAWILGSVGLIFAVQEVAALLSPKARPWAAALTCAGLIGLLSPTLKEPGHAQEGGVKPNEPSPLRITDTYLPALADAKNPTILGNVSTRFLWTWTFIEYHHHQNMAAELKNFKTYAGSPEPAKHWLATTRSEALVLIDVHPGTTYDWKTDEYVDLTAFRQALAEQAAWVQSARWEMPEGVTITLWKKTPP